MRHLCSALFICVLVSSRLYANDEYCASGDGPAQKVVGLTETENSVRSDLLLASEAFASLPEQLPKIALDGTTAECYEAREATQRLRATITEILQSIYSREAYAIAAEIRSKIAHIPETLPILGKRDDADGGGSSWSPVARPNLDSDAQFGIPVNEFRAAISEIIRCLRAAVAQRRLVLDLKVRSNETGAYLYLQVGDNPKTRRMTTTNVPFDGIWRGVYTGIIKKQGRREGTFEVDLWNQTPGVLACKLEPLESTASSQCWAEK